MTVSRGVVENSYPVRIRRVGGRAEFEVAGGLGYVPVTLTGLSWYRRPILEVREGGGGWSVVNQAVRGSDFWQSDFIAATGKWEITYTIPPDTTGDARQVRRFRFRIERG